MYFAYKKEGEAQSNEPLPSDEAHAMEKA